MAEAGTRAAQFDPTLTRSDHVLALVVALCRTVQQRRISCPVIGNFAVLIVADSTNTALRQL
jgi:hypothetical protein